MRRFVSSVLATMLIIVMLGNDASAAQPSSPSEASENTVTRQEFAQSFSNTLCYGGVSVRTLDMDGAVRAGLVEEVQPVAVEGNFIPALPYVSWGECAVNGAPTSLTRLTSSSPVVYMTLCDDMSSLGEMRITYAIIGGVQEANVVYLFYGLDATPCSYGTLYTAATNADWQAACLYAPIDVSYDPTVRSGFNTGSRGPVQFHCDSSATLYIP